MDVNFLSIYELIDMSYLKSDGLLGLSPVRTDKPDQHLLIFELKKDGAIDRALFSAYLEDGDHNSALHIGTWDQSIVDESILEFGSFEKDPEADENGIYWMDVNSQYHWQVKLLNAKTDDRDMRITAGNIFFDTGASLNYIPPIEHEELMNAIRKTKTCDLNSDQTYVCDCDSTEDEDFPVLRMQIGSDSSNRWFEFHSRFYAKKMSGKCHILIKVEHSSYFEDMWLMGAAFLRQYYSIHDLELAKIALV